MKAIDFACNLLKTLSESNLSTTNERVLFCVAAGLHHKEDICTFIGNSSAVSVSLKRLANHGFVVLQNKVTEYYSLTDEGRSHIAHLLRFLPTPRTA
ncbi:MAG: hypothetical protein Q4F35_07530 [Akkermansia sp.]|nr:hypothetical protein [Akkermansia sp.]